MTRSLRRRNTLRTQPARWCGLLGLVLCLAAPAAFALSNQLKEHASPYLALHGDDPVAWQDWNKNVVELAARENKLIYLSIGYFSCHWCHVMQQESYKNPEIAALLNKHFIPVKIDRELEPTLDARMIEFAEATRGAAGWPLNVFVTPQGDPLYAVLYVPPDQFKGIIARLNELWKDDAAGLVALARHEASGADGPGKPTLDPKQVAKYRHSVVAQALAQADVLNGGFGEQSKFPSAPQLELLLDEYARAQDKQLGEFLRLTLDQMAAQGLYDHLGGGFFRYCVDPQWRTPHFEKMLYDNAQLARLYMRAAKVFAHEAYRTIASETLDFMLAAMRDASGAFVASLSALDDKGVEGGYYLWDRAQLTETLSADEKAVFMRSWSMVDAPPFDDGYLPLKGLSPQEIARALKLDPVTVTKLGTSANQKARAARAKRLLPVDGKRLAGWNGLALAAFADAARVTGEPRYRAAAAGIRDYLMHTLWDGKALQRAVDARRGRAIGQVSVEDYAYVAEGLLAWASLTGAKPDYAAAKQVLTQAWARFYGAKGWRYGEQSLIGAEPTKDAIFDGPMPSPSGVIAAASLRLAAHTGDAALRDTALAALNSGHRQLAENSFWLATHIRAMTFAP